MQPVGEIDVLERFPPLSAELVRLLAKLPLAAWALPTACPGWSVKDVAAHLLGGSLGRAWQTTGAAPTQPGPGFDELLEIINQGNAAWVQAARRISPELLVELLELADRRMYERFKSLDPHAPALISVAWASDEIPPNWFDIAREYTEKWLHQQHIRAALGQPLLTEKHWLAPVLDTFLRGAPRAFRHVQAEEGASVAIHITGPAGGEWSLVRSGSGWLLFTGSDPQVLSRVQLDQDLAWQLFTRGLSPQDALPLVRISGRASLGRQVLETVSIMA